MKLFAVFLMTWGHAVHHLGLPEEDYYIVYNSGWMYSFHMPLFMILSGFVSYKIFEGTINIRRRFEQLIVPCFVFYSLQAVIPDTNNLWYLKSLFVCYVIWSLIYKSVCKYGPIKTSFIFLIGCLLLFPFLIYTPIVQTWKVDFMLPFFGIGILCHYKIDFIRDNLNKITLISLAFFVVLLFFFNPNWIWYYSRPQWIDYHYIAINLIDFVKNNNIHLADFCDTSHIKEVLLFNSLGYYFLRLLIGLMGSVFFICMGIIIEKLVGEKIGKLSKWGGYSLHVYILQDLLFIVLDKMNIKIPSNNIIMYSFIICPIVAIIMVSVYIQISRVLERNYYIARYLFGKI